MSSETRRLSAAKDLVSMRGFLALRVVETSDHTGADGNRIIAGTWSVLRPGVRAKPLLHVGYAIQQGMISLTYTPPNQPTRSWSWLPADTGMANALDADLLAVYESCLSGRQFQRLLAHRKAGEASPKRPPDETGSAVG